MGAENHGFNWPSRDDWSTSVSTRLQVRSQPILSAFKHNEHYKPCLRINVHADMRQGCKESTQAFDRNIVPLCQIEETGTQDSLTNQTSEAALIRELIAGKRHSCPHNAMLKTTYLMRLKDQYQLTKATMESKQDKLREYKGINYSHLTQTRFPIQKNVKCNNTVNKEVDSENKNTSE